MSNEVSFTDDGASFVQPERKFTDVGAAIEAATTKPSPVSREDARQAAEALVM